MIIILIHIGDTFFNKHNYYGTSLMGGIDDYQGSGAKFLHLDIFYSKIKLK
jgi:hypothetical protein